MNSYVIVSNWKKCWIQNEVFKSSKIASKTAQIDKTSLGKNRLTLIKYGNLNVSKQAGYCRLWINYNYYYQPAHYRKPYLFLFQTKPCDYSYPISELNCCPRESNMCPGNLIPISDQNMRFSLPYIRTELMCSRVQHVSWKPYPYFRSKYVIFPTLCQTWTAFLEGPACVPGTLSLFQTNLHVCKEISHLEFTWIHF